MRKLIQEIILDLQVFFGAPLAHYFREIVKLDACVKTLLSLGEGKARSQGIYPLDKAIQIFAPFMARAVRCRRPEGRAGLEMPDSRG